MPILAAPSSICCDVVGWNALADEERAGEEEEVVDDRAVVVLTAAGLKLGWLAAMWLKSGWDRGMVVVMIGGVYWEVWLLYTSELVSLVTA